MTFGGKYRCLYSRREPRAHGNMRKRRSNEEDKYMEFRPKGLAFFWPLITLFVRYISLDMLLANIMIINPKYSPANVIVIYLRLLKRKVPSK